MRYGILSDIHSNWEALQAVLQSCQMQGVEKIYCAGDIVGYGANPRECLERLMTQRIEMIAGNHDLAVGGRLDASYFTSDGKAAVAWTRNELPFEIYTALNNLPLILVKSEFELVHGTLDHPERFSYMLNLSDAAQTFDMTERNICFVGHTHVPQIFIKNKGQMFHAGELTLEIQPECQYVVNVGSVGQPRDGINLAAYCIFDTVMQMIEIHRVKYDIQKAQDKIIKAGLPVRLAQRLSTGH